MMKSMKRGFTLIELLVVIGIIGLLSSSFLVAGNQIRRSGRDNRRVADFEAVRQALQLYHIKCGMFPGSFDVLTNECQGGLVTVNPMAENPDSWGELKMALENAVIGFSDIPNDPSPGTTYVYQVQLGSGNATPRAQCYVLRATFETDHRALLNDLDDSDLGSKLLPSGTSAANKNLYPAFPPGASCNDGSGERNYCVGNIECFFGR